MPPRRRWLVAAAAAAAAVAAGASSVTYYVAPAGSDGTDAPNHGLSPADPLATLQYCVDALAALEARPGYEYGWPGSDGTWRSRPEPPSATAEWRAAQAAEK